MDTHFYMVNIDPGVYKIGVTKNKPISGFRYNKLCLYYSGPHEKILNLKKHVMDTLKENFESVKGVCIYKGDEEKMTDLAIVHIQDAILLGQQERAQRSLN